MELKSYGETNSNAQYAGELIAVQNDSLFLLMLNDSMHILPVSEIQGLKLAHYKYGAGNLYGYGAGMFVPSLLGMAAHSEYAGSFFALGLPIIVTAGLGTLINLTSYKIIKYPGVDMKSIQEFRKYARFPQGISNTINPQNLESKPVWLSH